MLPIIGGALSLIAASLLMSALNDSSPASKTEAVAALRQEQDDLRRLREEYDRKLKEMDEAHRREIERLSREIDALRRAGSSESKPGAGEAKPQSLEEDVDSFLRTAEAQKAAATRPELTQRLNEFNPRITVFGVFVGRADNHRVGEDLFPETTAIDESENLGNRFSLREAEVDMRADIDPFARGVLIATFAEEAPGEHVAEVEEGYAVLVGLPASLQAKIGQFRTEVGLNTKLHAHDLPQTSRPLPIRAYLGPEGDIEQGVSVSCLVPNPLDAPFEATLQVVNGENEEIFAGTDSKDPAYLGHLRYFQDLTENQFLEIGATDYYGINDADREDSSNLAAFDLLYRWRPRASGQYQSVVASAEGFWLHRQREGLDALDALGAYAFLQYQPTQNWYLGARGDYAESPDDNSSRASGTSVYVTWYTTEFLRFRLSYEYLARNFDDDLSSVLLEVTWVFGSHPAEPYWVSR